MEEFLEELAQADKADEARRRAKARQLRKGTTMPVGQTRQITMKGEHGETLTFMVNEEVYQHMKALEARNAELEALLAGPGPVDVPQPGGTAKIPGWKESEATEAEEG